MDQSHFDEKRFLLFVKDQARIIREHAFDINQITTILNHLTREWQTYSRVMGTKQISDPNLMHEVVSEFLLSLQIAFSNYRRENRSMWATIFGFGASRLPKLNSDLFMK